MLDPSALYRFETDVDPRTLRASTMVVALGSFIDAGHTQRMVVDQLLGHLEHRVVASFDVDQLLDYRGRRPMMTFDSDRFTEYDDPSMVLYQVVDSDGTPFLLLTGPEPDYQWERVIEAVRGFVRLFGVSLVVSFHGIPMAVPHTRPVGMTKHGTRPELLGENDPVWGRVQVPASLAQLLELRLGEVGTDAVGYSVHVPQYLAQAEFGDAALTALRAVAAVTGLDLPTADLAAKAGLARDEIEKEVAGNEEVGQVVAALEQQYDAFMRGRERPSLLAASEAMPTADEIGAEFEQFLRTRSEHEGENPQA